ncbi:MAG TPA: dUTP diphosphatase [Puia sp.]|nr:dUTP diphosphatase [Puia sp.]
MANLQVKILKKSDNPLPEYVTEGSAGIDISANQAKKISIKPFERILIPTGLFIELPPDYQARIRPRSGLAIRSGISCLNSPGTIDSDFRGEINVILINLSHEEHYIARADRVAKMIVSRIEKVKWRTAQKMSVTERNDGGFGHSGKS